MNTIGIKRLSAFILAISIFVGTATLVSAAELPEPTDKAAITVAQQKAYDEAVTLKIIYDTNIQNCTFSWSNGKYLIKTYKVISGPYTGIVFQPTYPDVTQDTSSANGKPSNPATGNKLTDEQLKECAKEVCDLVNKERKKEGLTLLDYREDVAEAAQIRAKEIEVTFSHTRPDDTKFSTVLDESNIMRRWAAENIAKGQSKPERAMKWWMDSEDHRKNILTENITAMGVGVYQDTNGKIFWVQIFIEEK